jgi:hypothetical protein
VVLGWSLVSGAERFLRGLVSAGFWSRRQDVETVCNIDVFVDLPDGSRWSAAVFTLAEVECLMNWWASTGEALGGRYFWCSDGLIVQEPSVPAMAAVLAGLLESGDFHHVLQQVEALGR